MKNFIWDEEQNICVSRSRIRNFTIEPTKTDTFEPFVDKTRYKVVAWFSDNETISLGSFNDHEKAKDFIVSLVEE